MLITPISNPVAIFTLIISIILFVPFISKRLNIPSIFGLIVAGLIIGPNGTGLLENNQSVSMFATVGLLYIMFLAGLEINFNSFLQNRNKSIFFGAATFFVPLIIGFVILRYVMQFTFLPALLVSSMFSTHTLISYPNYYNRRDHYNRYRCARSVQYHNSSLRRKVEWHVLVSVNFPFNCFCICCFMGAA